ncbi:MAG: PRC-barrel domain-containing protein [Actinomycetota bacterium]|nr:PRC-barrel domain-containing protein [Actinomycetota bacterium]
MAHTTVNYGEPRNRFEAPEEYVGYRVYDPEGQKIGNVKELYANAGGEPEYVRVKTGLFGSRGVLIPIGFVAVDDERRTLTLQ